MLIFVSMAKSTPGSAVVYWAIQIKSLEGSIIVHQRVALFFQLKEGRTGIMIGLNF